MIFDSAEITNIRLQYATVPTYNLPEILVLDRKDAYLDERAVMEQCIHDVSPQKQKQWLGNLYSKNSSNFMGAWFEMMLFHWLKSAGNVEVEPEILGSHPDFMLTLEDQKIIIEARAFLIKEGERQRTRWQSAIFNTIDQLEFPYVLTILSDRLTCQPDTDLLKTKITQWLGTMPEERFVFDDRQGNLLVFESEYCPSLDKSILFWQGSAQFINPNIVKPPIKEKAKTHTAIRRAGYPFVIALFIEDFLFSVDEVINAWFGNEQIVIDIEQEQIIERKRDRTGLLLYRNEISHRTVSGIMVFKTVTSPDFRGRLLQGWFVENPYAYVKIDSQKFPVKSTYGVIDCTQTHYRLGWLNTDKDIDT
jgi:hypothetical protein